MKIKLKQDQSYISIKGGVFFGFKGDIVDADDAFVNLIAGKYEIAKEKEEKTEKEKPLEKMNKGELVEKAKELGIELSEKEIETMTKANIIDKINEVK